MEKENSRYKWIVFGTVLLSYLIIVSQRTAPGLITNTLLKDFNITAATIGLLTSIQFFAYASLQIPIGILSDRFGPNYFLIIGTLLNGAGTIIYSLAPNEFVLLFARLLVGIGDSAIWVNLILILSKWFKLKEFVGLLGIAGLTGSLGSLLATVPFAALITYTGWRGSFFSVGIILCLVSVLLYFILEKIPKKMLENHPAFSKSPVIIDNHREKTLVMLKRIFSDRQAWATFLCHFGLVGTYIGFIGSWAVPYGMDMYGMTRSDASQLIMIGLIGAIIGAPLTGWIASHSESLKRPYIVAHLLTFVSWAVFLLLAGRPPFFMVIILYFMIGIGCGASSLTFAVVRKSFDSKVVGVVTGFANTGGFLSAVLLPSIFGNVLDHFQAESSVGYHYGFILPTLFSMLGLIGGILIKEQRQEIKHTKKSIS